MNKYQESLNKLETWSADLMEVLPTVYKEWHNKNKKVEYYKELKETVATLQELVEKAMPKKAILTHDYDGYVYECPNCHMEFRPDYIMYTVKWKGCPYCFQVLDWGEEDVD